MFLPGEDRKIAPNPVSSQAASDPGEHIPGEQPMKLRVLADAEFGDSFAWAIYLYTSLWEGLRD